MNGVEFNQLRSTINSLMASTMLDIQVGSIVCHLDRRCSEYVSHRTVEYRMVGEAIPAGVVLFTNNIHVLSVGAGVAELLLPMPHCARYEQVTLGDWVPETLVSDLLYLAEKQIGAQQLVVSSLDKLFLTFVQWTADRLDHFDEDGRPVFAPRVEAEEAPAVDDDNPAAGILHAIVDGIDG